MKYVQYFPNQSPLTNTYEPVLITWTTLGNGSTSIVLVFVALSTEVLSISAQNRYMSTKSTQQKNNA